VLAKLVVTADHVSGGRIDLGLGAGWHLREHEAYGFPFAPTRVRMDVLEEQLQVLMGTWGLDRFSFEGDRYVLSDLDAQPKPVQRPHPPLLIGGSAGARSAALAARFADEYNTPFPALEDVPRLRSAVVEACERAGRDPIPFSAMIGTVLGADATDLEDRARRVAERTGSPADALLRAPPKGWVVATVEHAAEQFAAYRDAGLHRVMCQTLVHDDLDAVALIGELAPLLR
jgi:alkanesulfonate monooxygenase SsuD/methylene tetrahydromethanopterin reductase-like flavin-dependent oxidoreductase (luciferase family)